ncbi:hypothetical protein KAF25_000196 [Fusarium avenaceum]|uniref:Uncharacterized protein n=1 Tax=Fusarium avenaceum TaxID=40199 RepID=A0A9P7GRT2_9HYPO|nr:hypothetical protein KAF25_000196 [Fusarium avenaceum]
MLEELLLVLYTRTAVANTVTTVTYITVHLNNPGYLITSQAPVTLGYTPCNCDYQAYPPVDMTTIVTACHACGANGENSVTLTVPTAACEADGVKPGYPNEVFHSAHNTMEHEIYSEVNSFAGPKPTMGEHSEPSPVHGSPKPNGQGKPQPSRANAPRPVSTVPDASAVIEPPRPLPTSAYQVPASKACTTEQHASGQIHKPEATQVSYPAAPWDGQSTSTPVVVASATRHYLMT